MIVFVCYLESYCFAVSALSLHRFCVFCISQHYKTSCGCNFLITSSYKAPENKSTGAISFATEQECKIPGHHLYWIFQSSMKNTSYSKPISWSGVWLHPPSWERPTSLAASHFIWSDPFIFSVSGWESVNPNQYFHLLTPNTSPSNFTSHGICPVILRQDLLSLVSHLLVAPCSPWFHGTIWQVSIWICCYFAGISVSRNHHLLRD